MEEENKEKKESIEEILSDLNNLLNKMPSILSDIKVPETKPVEFFESEKEHIETEHEVEKPAEEVVAEPPKEQIIETLEEAKISADKDADVWPGEQTADREPVSVADEGIETMSPQTAGDKEKIEVDKQNIKELAAALNLEEHQEKLENLYDQTKSFGVPDIDDLFKIAEEPKQLDKSATTNEEMAEINAEGGKMNLDENPKDEDISRNQNSEEPNEEKSNEEKPQEKPQEKISDEKEPIEPVMQTEQQPQVEIKPEIAPDIPSAVNMEQTGDAQEIKIESAGDIQLQPEAGFTEEQPALEIQPLEVSADTGEEKTPMMEPLEIQKEPALESQTPPSTSTEPGEEKTVVLEPGSVQFGQGITEGQSPFGDSPLGDKTIMVSEEALTTSRTKQSADLSSLVTRQPPEQMPPERIKSIGFLYSMEEEKMCAELLQEIDSICSKSSTKSMFIKRAFVKVFEPDIKGNYILEVVSQTQGMGLVCVGNIPQENIYEVENVFNSSNVFFRHINQENFNHASIVNLITDLIIL